MLIQDKLSRTTTAAWAGPIRFTLGVSVWIQMRAQHTPAMLAVPVSLVNRFRGHWCRLTFLMFYFPANLPKTKSLFSSCTFLLQTAADKSLGFPHSNLVPPARLKIQSERGMETGSAGNLMSCWENSILSPISLRAVNVPAKLLRQQDGNRAKTEDITTKRGAATWKRPTRAQGPGFRKRRRH